MYTYPRPSSALRPLKPHFRASASTPDPNASLSLARAARQSARHENKRNPYHKSIIPAIIMIHIPLSPHTLHSSDTFAFPRDISREESLNGARVNGAPFKRKKKIRNISSPCHTRTCTLFSRLNLASFSHSEREREREKKKERILAMRIACFESSDTSRHGREPESTHSICVCVFFRVSPGERVHQRRVRGRVRGEEEQERKERESAVA